MKGASHLKFHEKIMGIIEDRDDLTSSSVALKIGVSKQYMSKFKKRHDWVLPISKVIACNK